MTAQPTWIDFMRAAIAGHDGEQFPAADDANQPLNSGSRSTRASRSFGRSRYPHKF